MLKRNVWAALIAIAVTPAAVTAQEANINITAEILEELSITTIDETLDFGEIAPGAEPEVDPGSDQAGRLEINGSGGQDVSVDADDQVTLDNGGTGTIEFTSDLWGAEGENAEDPEEEVDPNGSVQLGADGFYQLFLGGSLGNTDVDAGTYTGQFTLEVEYVEN